MNGDGVTSDGVTGDGVTSDVTAVTRPGRPPRPAWRRAARSAVLGLLAGGLLLAGCSTGGQDATGDEAVEGLPAPEVGGLAPEADDAARAEDGTEAGTSGEGTASDLDAPATQNRSVIFTVDLVVEVDDVAAAADRAAQVATQFGGYVQSETTFGLDEPPQPEPLLGSRPFVVDGTQAILVLRVPAERHLDAADALSDLGEVISRSRNAQDVTDEVVDVESRIETQEASIDRLQALLGDASDIGDILAIETELTMRIAELESLRARQEQLTGLADLATITVTFAPPETVVEEGTGFVAGLQAGWRAFVRAGVLGLTALGAVLPFVGLVALLLAPLVAWLVVRHRRRRAQRPDQPEAAPPSAPADDAFAAPAAVASPVGGRDGGATPSQHDPPSGPPRDA